MSRMGGGGLQKTGKARKRERGSRRGIPSVTSVLLLVTGDFW